MSTTAILSFQPLPSLVRDEDAARPLPSRGRQMEILSDRALVERVARGDADAFTALDRRYEKPLFGVLLRLAGRRALAEDWLQETFTRVWLAAGTHDPARGEVRPWIFKIALNTARSELGRKRHRTPHVSLEETGIELIAQGAGEDGIAERLDEARRRGALAKALLQLPAFMREVVVLRCSRELTFAEISDVTGAPQGTLKARFHRAVAALREAVGREEGRAR
jgi:RNA polymerase sigma-70 factor (ECF subfamily)